MNGAEKYQYGKLSGSDAIRLIKLYSSPDLEAQVCCELLHTSLTECEDDVFNVYTAISYVCKSFHLLCIAPHPSSIR